MTAAILYALVVLTVLAAFIGGLGAWAVLERVKAGRIRAGGHIYLCYDAGPLQPPPKKSRRRRLTFSRRRDYHDS